MKRTSHSTPKGGAINRAENRSLRSHQRLFWSLVSVIALQVMLLFLTLAFSISSHRQASEILAVDIAASQITLDFQQVSVTLQNLYAEMSDAKPRRPYIEVLQADLKERLSELEKCIVEVSGEYESECSALRTIDSDMHASLVGIAPQLDAFMQRARSFAASDFETLKARYGRPSITDLAAVRTRMVHQTLRKISNAAQARQATRIDEIHKSIMVATILSLFLLAASWLWILRPALARQKRATLQEIEISANLAMKNAALQQAENHALILCSDAQRAIKAQTGFLAVVSHELRTPLNAVIGFSEIMKDELFGKHTVPAYRGYATEIHASGKHLLQIVDDILEFSRYESERIMLDVDAVMVKALLKDVHTVMAHQAEGAGVHLAFGDRPRQGIMLDIDYRLVRQSLLNIIDNAIKFSPKGGTVTISVQHTDDGELAIRITDEGEGIDCDAIPRLLRPFEQIESAFSRTKGGLGLGLAIANRIMQAHEGRVDIDSARSNGCCVSLVFPPSLLLRTTRHGISFGNSTGKRPSSTDES